MNQFRVAARLILWLALGLVQCTDDIPFGCRTTMSIDLAGNGVVSSRFRRQDTGLEVVAGDEIEITASGEICLNSNATVCSGPQGETDGTFGLWAQVGENDFPFFVGDYYRRIASVGGSLYMVIPDGDDEYVCTESNYWDNSGSFDVTIKITHYE